MYRIRDISLAPQGEQKIEWVRRNMPILNGIRASFEKDLPFRGLKIALSIHLEAKTAYLCRVLAAGGAEMYVTGSNPLSTQDDIVAALAEGGINVFALHGATKEEYNECIESVLMAEPDIIIDDGGDLVHAIHTKFPQLIGKILGGCEETTTGIVRLVAMDKAQLFLGGCQRFIFQVQLLSVDHAAAAGTCAQRTGGCYADLRCSGRIGDHLKGLGQQHITGKHCR